MTEPSTLDQELEMMLEGEGSALKAKGRSEVDSIVEKLEDIAHADSRLLYKKDGSGKMLSPPDWPDSIASAVVRITPNAHGNIVQLADKGRALEALARIKGAFKPDDEAKSPLEELFDSVPREDRLLIVKQLIALSKHAQEYTKRTADVDESDTLRTAEETSSDEDELPDEDDERLQTVWFTDPAGAARGQKGVVIKDEAERPKPGAGVPFVKEEEPDDEKPEPKVHVHEIETF